MAKEVLMLAAAPTLADASVRAPRSGRAPVDPDPGYDDGGPPILPVLATPLFGHG